MFINFEQQTPTETAKKNFNSKKETPSCKREWSPNLFDIESDIAKFFIGLFFGCFVAYCTRYRKRLPSGKRGG
jgi:hypothetical protein